MLALMNLVYALKHGFAWIHYVSFALAAAVLIIEILEAIHEQK